MIRIVNALWRVILVDSKNPVLMRPNGTYTLGCCYNYDKTIYISNSLLPEKQRQVLAHELTHAFIFELDIKIPVQEEEKICNMVADYGKNIFDMVDLLAMTFERARA